MTNEAKQHDIAAIVDHHDGHGLNESIEITKDEPGPGGASHHYVFKIDGKTVGELQFQRGARNEEGSTPGLTTAAVIAALIDQMRGFQTGAFPSSEGALVITKLEEAAHWLRARADNRARRGVLGVDKP
jgi:hypothetical protein